MTDQTNNESQLAPGGDTTFISSTTGVRHSFLPGDVIDNSYQLTSLLGQGGMGVVFACRHVVLGKNYAMKLLKGDQLSGEYWSRFKAEAQALAQLNHPGIVGIHNMGVDGGQFPYYVMDLVPGEALDLLISKNGRVPVNEALDIFIQVADALGSAHLQGIIHRDVKPSNMMLVRDDKNGTLCVKIVDFGIARLSKHGFAAQSQTKTGMIFGTPFYMSPEQCQGLRVDQRSDIYSLGCTIFEALTGYTPFRGENSFHTFMLHQTEAPPSLKDLAPKGEFPEALEQALAKMLAKGPAERYQTMAQVKHDLERIRAGKSIKPQGVSTTIAPGQAQAVQESIQRYRQIEHENVEKQEVSDKLPTRSRAKISLIGGTAVIMSAAAGYIFFNHGTGSKSAESINAKIIINKTPNTKTLNTKTSGSIKADDLVAGTTGMPDLDSFMDPNLEEFSKNSDKLKPLLKAYRANPETAHSPFKQNVEPPGFQFPNGFLIGHIKIGDADPVMATGFVQAPPGKPVHMYLSNFTKDWPEILDKFGPADLTGLDIQAQDPEIIIQKIRYWTKLDELSFFNPLIKALPRAELKYDESALENKHLPLIDKLTNLQSLGLCGQNISGDAILKMHLLDRLHTLKLKRIKNLDALLKALPDKNNLTEIWLVAQDTTDEELEPLTRMKNLTTLRIRRSILTPASVDYFKRMPALKHLTLDRDWAPAVMKQFKSALPIYEYEPVLDFKYWKMFPGKV